MDYYFLEIKIEEFIYNSNESNINGIYNTQKKKNINENKNINYEIIFELTKSKGKYSLQIINDKKGNKIPFSTNFNLPTLININNENSQNDFLTIFLYIKNPSNNENKQLIDIDKGKLIDISCIKVRKFYTLKIGNFSMKFSFQLIKKEITDKNNIEHDIKYHKINSDDFFDINVDIFEEEEKEDEDYYEEKSEKNPFELAQEINPKKIYRNTHMSLYQIYQLEQPILKEVIKDNLVECFLISGLSQSKQEIKNSEGYISQCNHKNFCEKNISYFSQIFFRLQKPNSIFEKIDSNLISNLIFPNGIKICFGYNKYLNNFVKNRNFSFFKNSNFSYNVLTDINGKRYYIYSLIFFIKFDYNDFSEIYKDYKNIGGIDCSKLNNKNIFIPYSFSVISKIFDVEKFNIILKDLYITFSSNEFKPELFDNELVHLIFEIPSPPENSKIKIFLPNSQIEIYSNIYKNENYNNINIFDIIFQNYSYNFNFIIKIFILLILEKRIILYSSNMNKIFLTIESILHLIYPLKWVMTYIPIIPDENINLILESFLPFIIGMTTKTYLNYSHNIKNLMNSNHNTDNNNNYNNKWDNIFIIDLDSENITPKKMIGEIINSCPICQFINDEYIRCRNNGEINDEKIKKIFFDSMILLLGDFEKFTSKLGDNILFNQKMFLEYKTNNFKIFYQETTSTQQFYHFINEINSGNENLYYGKFRENIKLRQNVKLRKKNGIKKIKNIYIDDYYLYPYFFEKKVDGEGEGEGGGDADLDLFNFEDEIDLYYNCLDKEDDINYLLDTEAFLRIKLILKNYIPENLRKYEVTKEKYNRKKINEDEDLNNYDSNVSSELDLDIIENTKSILGDIYGKVKKSITKIIQRKSILNSDENKENISTNVISGEKVEYRHRNSLIKMIKENTNKNELLKYKEQIIDLLKDYIGYILSNQNSDIIFSDKELSKLLKYRRIRRELSKIIYQKKFETKIEHELSEETFELLYQSVFFCLINLNDNENEYKTLQRIIKSMFYYYKRKIKFGKIYLYQKFLDKNGKFFFKSSLNFWKYYYKLEIIDNENNNEYHYDKNELVNKIKNDMFLIEVDDNIVNFFE